MRSKPISIHYLQHVSFEGPGSIAAWAERKGHSLTYTRFYAQERLPAPDAIDWLVVMGGPMGVDDEAAYPWLRQEKEFIKAAVSEGKTVIGICLGAQLIAGVLGAGVYPNPQKEIGWFPVQLTGDALGHSLFEGFPEELTVFHWHGDTFDLPENALPIASSRACRNQGYLYRERVLGLQFHFEISSQQALEEMLKEGVEQFRTVELSAGETAGAPGGGGHDPALFVQAPEEILSGKRFIPAANRWLDQLLDRLEAGMGGSAGAAASFRRG